MWACLSYSEARALSMCPLMFSPPWVGPVDCRGDPNSDHGQLIVLVSWWVGRDLHGPLDRTDKDRRGSTAWTEVPCHVLLVFLPL